MGIYMLFDLYFEFNIHFTSDLCLFNLSYINVCCSKGNLHLSEIGHVVLDEVDQMLDMGFAPKVEEILQYAYTDGNLKSVSSCHMCHMLKATWFCNKV